MAHAKKVNFHFLSQIKITADFGPGILGPFALKDQNGQTYIAQFHQKPSKNSAKPLGKPSAWTLSCKSWTWTAGTLNKVSLFSLGNIKVLPKIQKKILTF